MAETIETPVAPAPEAEQVDLASIKQMVDLPATATDVELITVLVNLIANLQEKYEELLQDAVTLEDNVTNRDIAEFADVIDENTAPFWKEQILSNRSVALEALSALRAKIAVPAPAPEPAPAAPAKVTIPLRNRLAAIERTVEAVAEAKPSAAIANDAVKIRNRAHEIVKSQKVPFIVAFARAEKEITAPKE